MDSLRTAAGGRLGTTTCEGMPRVRTSCCRRWPCVAPSAQHPVPLSPVRSSSVVSLLRGAKTNTSPEIQALRSTVCYSHRQPPRQCHQQGGLTLYAQRPVG